MQTIDIVLVLIDLLFYGMVLTKRTKVGPIQQNYNIIDGINFRAVAKRFTHKTTDIFFPSVNSAVITSVKVGLKGNYFSNISVSGCLGPTTLKDLTPTGTSKTLQRSSWIISGRI